MLGCVGVRFVLRFGRFMSLCFFPQPFFGLSSASLLRGPAHSFFALSALLCFTLPAFSFLFLSFNESVVTNPRPLDTENLIRFVNLLEPFLRIRSIVAVRMQCQGQLSVPPTDGFISGVPIQAQDFVVIGWHGASRQSWGLDTRPDELCHPLTNH